MAAERIDGKLIAQKVREEAAGEAAALREAGIIPSLVVIWVGDNPASKTYVGNKEKAAKAAGIEARVMHLPEETTQQDVVNLVRSLNEDKAVHGILVQLPLPAHMNEAEVLAEVSPEKDVDGFTSASSGRLMIGEDGFVPCTPLGIMKMLEVIGEKVEGKHAVVVGRSRIVGKPMALLLLAQNATVTVCHSRTSDLASITRQADILVAAVGKPRMITGDMVKPGATVIDVGINRVEGKLCGDVDEASVSAVAGKLTPVPGGVGPMTIAMLLCNTLKAAKRCGN